MNDLSVINRAASSSKPAPLLASSILNHGENITRVEPLFSIAEMFMYSSCLRWDKETGGITIVTSIHRDSLMFDSSIIVSLFIIYKLRVL